MTTPMPHIEEIDKRQAAVEELGLWHADLLGRRAPDSDIRNAYEELCRARQTVKDHARADLATLLGLKKLADAMAEQIGKTLDGTHSASVEHAWIKYHKAREEVEGG